jgi:NifU-like protein
MGSEPEKSPTSTGYRPAGFQQKEPAPTSDVNPNSFSTPTAPEPNILLKVNPPSPPLTPDGTERKFSKKIATLSANPKHRGAFFTEDASSKDLALCTAKFKDIKVYWLVDPQSDLIYDAKFFSYGGPISMALGEILCSLVKGMKLESACAITITQIESLLRDEDGLSATLAPAEEAFASLPPLLAHALEVYASAKALALATLTMKASQNGQPRRSSFESLTQADEEWLKKPKEEQIQSIDEVITRDVRPGLNMDGGDLQIRDLEEGHRLLIKYQGACGSCGSSTGATLAFIEDALRRQVFSGIQVIPIEE